jgi:putative ABC transport system permease protein
MRYKEIGVKKILGSQNSLIRKQFLVESIILSVIAFPIAYVIAFWSVDFLNQLFNISLEINIFKNPNQLFAFFFLLILIGVLAGSYIAFYLSRLNPLEIIKSKLGNQNRKIRFQYLMLLFQIIVFTGLTGASFSIYKQIDYLKNADTGINFNNKLIVLIEEIELNNASYQTLSKIVSDIPEVKNFTLGWSFPPENSRSVTTAPHPEDETRRLKYETEGITFDYFEFFELECLQGRFFETELNTDSSKIVLNESAVNLFEFKDPIGKIINGMEVIGVVKDFHIHSLHEGVAPTSFSLLNPKYIDKVAIEYQDGLAEICIAKLEQEIAKFIPEAPIEIYLISDAVENMYASDKKLNNIIIYFSLFAIVIALIGIFGQSLFAVRQQVKEIGIRKVNGATSGDIIVHVLKKYTLLCVLANLISWPIVYLLLEKWQEAFVYKSPFSIWLVLFTLSASIFVVLGTVIVNAWRAARTNPVEVLKYE